MTNKIRRFIAPTVLFALACLTGFKAESGIEASGQPASPSGARLSLTLEGFNYTNRYIDDFTVDGHSGGNLRVSGPGGGGGGSACCVSYVPTVTPKSVTIRWQVGGCIFLSKSSDGTVTFENTYPYFRQTNVVLDEKGGKEPKYISVHFYPDGTVQAAVSETLPSPRLLLEKGRVDRSKYPRCPNNKKPS